MLAQAPDGADAIKFLVGLPVVEDLRVLIPLGIALAAALIVYAVRGHKRPVSAGLEYAAVPVWVIVTAALFFKLYEISGLGSFSLVISIGDIVLAALLVAGWKFFRNIILPVASHGIAPSNSIPSKSTPNEPVRIPPKKVDDYDEIKRWLDEIKSRYSSAIIYVNPASLLTRKGKIAFDWLINNFPSDDSAKNTSIIYQQIVKDLEAILYEIGDVIEKTRELAISGENREQLNNSIKKFFKESVERPAQKILAYYDLIRRPDPLNQAQEEYEKWGALLSRATPPSNLIDASVVTQEMTKEEKRPSDQDIEVLFKFWDSESQLGSHKFRPSLGIVAINHRPHAVQVTEHSVEEEVDGEWKLANASFNDRPHVKDWEVVGQAHRDYQTSLPRTLQPNERSWVWHCDVWHPKSQRLRGIIIADDKRYESKPYNLKRKEPMGILDAKQTFEFWKRLKEPSSEEEKEFKINLQMSLASIEMQIKKIEIASSARKGWVVVTITIEVKQGDWLEVLADLTDGGWEKYDALRDAHRMR